MNLSDVPTRNLTASLHGRLAGTVGALELEELERRGIGERYNGWKNYPTWCVNLWLQNEEPLYREALNRVRATQQRYAGPYFVAKDVPRHEVADALKDWVRDELAPDLGATFAADLLGYALDQVDWLEIADAWIRQALRDLGEAI